MKTRSRFLLSVWTGIVAVFLLGEGESETGEATVAKPKLYRKVKIPRRLLQRAPANAGGHLYGGDIRMGDLTGNGRADFVVFRNTEPLGIKPCFVGAFSGKGKSLWHHGKGGSQPTRPGSVAIHDIDADGRSEVISLFVDRERSAGRGSFANIALQVRNGLNGSIEKQARPKALTAWDTSEAGTHGNWAHQRIVIANLRGRQQPQDFVIKLGYTYLAFDNELNVLWSHRVPEHDRFEHCSYIPAVGDVDGDEADEVYGGHVLIDDTGERIWYQIMAHQMDSVAVREWDEGKTRLIASGWGQVLNSKGEPIIKLGKELVPHGQEVRVADFSSRLPGPEMMLRYNGHRPSVMLVSNDGRVIRKFDINPTPNNTGLDAVYWEGSGRPAMLVNGSSLWTPKGRRVATMPELPDLVGPTDANRTMAWYHVIPANVCGDKREEAILFNPWDRYVFIYTPKPLRDHLFSDYTPGPRQYNVQLMD